MKKSIFTGMITILTLLGAALSSHAIPLGYPDISFDSTPGGTGLTYTAATGDLHVNAALQTIRMPDGSVLTPGGTVDYHMTYVSSSSSGDLITATFGTSPFTPDLVVTDKDGTVLLTGEFSSASLTGPVIWDDLGVGAASLTITGGTLAALFMEGCGGNPDCGVMVNLTFNLSVPFSSTMFVSDFTGEIKGDIGSLPEPASLLLMGSGLLALGVWGRKRFKGLKEQSRV